MWVLCRERILREFRANSPLRDCFSKKEKINCLRIAFLEEEKAVPMVRWYGLLGAKRL
jgi:hypothetical protein